MTSGGIPPFSIPHHQSSFDVAIAGGGLAGLAAAVDLASDGARVALFERSPKLGGRCYSYVDEKTGDVVDNGQHVLIGAYHSTLRYLDMIGTHGLLRQHSRLSLPLHHPTKGFSSFEISSLPKPFHLTTGMLKFGLLSLQERRRLLNVGFALTSWNPSLEEKLARLTIEQWLDGLNQSEEAKNCLWYPVAISMMNESPRRASALLFARSLRAAFLGKKSDSSILIPRVGQTELYVREAEKLILSRGGSVVANTEVHGVEISKTRAIGLKLGDGRRIKAGSVISAVPYFALRKMIPSGEKRNRPFAALPSFESSPIISIHLWFGKEFMDMEYIGLIGRRLQWVFNRRRILGEEKNTGHVSAVISGARDIVELPKEKLVSIAVEDLHAVFPESRNTQLVHAVVIKEKRATFSPTNEIEPLRPSCETPIKNFVLAGDWTNTGLPATIEGAVASGFTAAGLAKRTPA